jgi:hypothetical protein
VVKPRQRSLTQQNKPSFDSGKVQEARGGDGELTKMNHSSEERMETARGSGWQTTSSCNGSASRSEKNKARERGKRGSVNSQSQCEARQLAYGGVDKTKLRNKLGGGSA